MMYSELLSIVCPHCGEEWKAHPEQNSHPVLPRHCSACIAMWDWELNAAKEALEGK